MELLKEKRGHSCTICFVYCLYTVYYVLYQCIVYWIHFQNIHTFIYQKSLLLTLFKLLWKLLKAISVSLRTNILLHYIKRHFILVINQSQSIKTICFQIYFIYTIKWGWLGPIFGIFHGLLTHSNHSTTWHPEYMTLCPHSVD